MPQGHSDLWDFSAVEPANYLNVREVGNAWGRLNGEPYVLNFAGAFHERGPCFSRIDSYLVCIGAVTSVGRNPVAFKIERLGEVEVAKHGCEVGLM